MTSRALTAAKRPHCSAVEPTTEISFLSAGKRGDRLAVFGMALDEREGLQDRVVQMFRDSGTFRLADTLVALGSDGAHEARQTGSGDQRDAGGRHEDCERCVPQGRQRDPLRGKHPKADDHEHRAAEQAAE